MRSTGLPSWAKHVDFIVIDLVSLAIAFALSYWLKFGNLGFVSSSTWRGLFVMVLLTDVVITLLSGPYSGVFRRSYWEDVGTSLKLALWNLILVSLAFYLLKIGHDYSREMILVTYVAYPMISTVLKALHKKALLSRGAAAPADSVRRIVLVTLIQDAAQMESYVGASDMNDALVVGFCLVDASPDADSRDGGLAGATSQGGIGGRPVSDASGLVGLCAEVNADEVVVTVAPGSVDEAIYERLVDDGVRVRFAIAESLGVSSESQRIGRAGVLRTLDLERYAFGADQLLYLPVKRVFDILFGLVGCVLAVLVAAVVKVCCLACGDAHPIFYSQERVGLRGKPFKMFKIRSMVWDADTELERLLEDPVRRLEWERDQKLADDPRVTRVGRVLRRTSLDEMPQFLNVLRGEMSIVGPRPLVPGELEEHGGRPLYNRVKPGITGWWGCNGRSNIDYRERLELEYHYVRHCSLYLDIICIFRTVAAVLKREGAH